MELKVIEVKEKHDEIKMHWVFSAAKTTIIVVYPFIHLNIVLSSYYFSNKSLTLTGKHDVQGGSKCYKVGIGSPPSIPHHRTAPDIIIHCYI